MTAAFAWGGPAALLIAVLLCVMEVSLSFDNAVVNAAVLRRMSPAWQRRFLTWGILVAVFGVRLVLPVIIVAAAAGVGPWEVARIAATDAPAYAAHLKAAHVGIAAFGGMFLFLVFLHFAFDRTRDVYWLGWVERRLAVAGRLEAVEVAVALGTLLLVQRAAPEAERLTAMVAGVLGVATFVVVRGLAGLAGAADPAAAAARSGAAGFLYLEVLDASFSLDGVIGAFAITSDVAVVAIGLAVGALFVRTLTVQLVQRGTLEKYIYLEHGAHWGIGALAAIMLAGVRVEIPEAVTGLAGATAIGLSLVSSIRHNRRSEPNRPLAPDRAGE